MTKPSVAAGGEGRDAARGDVALLPPRHGTPSAGIRSGDGTASGRPVNLLGLPELVVDRQQAVFEDGPVTRAGNLTARLAGAIEFAARQLGGGGEVDQFGFDPEFNSRVLIPLARFFYRRWFQVHMQGLANVPAAGPGLVVANHSGALPFDAIMLQAGLHDEHPGHRNLRLLGADLVYEVPLLGALARRGGHTRACPANAHVLLRSGELVGVFPEGFKGIGKPFADRYQLQRFGRGGFAVSAIRAQVPIIPCAVVGAEEIYPLVGNAKPIAELLGLPYFPITPLFPWLGPLGAVPLPSRWIIEFCPPVATDCYERGSENDPAVIADLSGRVRGTIQRKLDDLLTERGPAFG
ncbi:MAG TPA: lysophospholipid acyltransferase family protein [Streptosporangiaceae bacterium]